VHDGVRAYIEHFPLLVTVARGAAVDNVPSAAPGALVRHDDVTCSGASSRLAPLYAIALRVVSSARRVGVIRSFKSAIMRATARVV